MCARMRTEYDQGIWYVPEAEVAHKVFQYRTKVGWLLDRAFWQGYSKRAMETLLDDNDDEEVEFLTRLITDFTLLRIRNIIQSPSIARITQLVMLWVFTATVGIGYLYGYSKY